MPLKSKFNVIVGTATILGAVFAGISVKAELFSAYTTVKETASVTLRGPIRERADELATVAPTASKPEVEPQAVSRPARVRRTRSRSRPIARTRRPAKRRSVSIFAVAKDIKHPNSVR